MIGIEQAGVAETMDYVFKKFSPEDQNRLAQVLQLDQSLRKLAHAIYRDFFQV